MDDRLANVRRVPRVAVATRISEEPEALVRAPRGAWGDERWRNSRVRSRCGERGPARLRRLRVDAGHLQVHDVTGLDAQLHRGCVVAQPHRTDGSCAPRFG